jgi:signal transduction histidine kinase
VGLTVFGWLQLALIPLLFAPPNGLAGPGPGDFVVVAPFFSLELVAPTWTAYVLVACAFLPLALRRRYPATVLITAVSAAGIYTLTRQPPVLISLAPVIAVYTAGTVFERRKLVVLTLIAIAIALPTSLYAQPLDRRAAETARWVALFAAAAAAGDATRNRRAYVAEVEQRAIEAERTRDEEARRRVEEERLRIARELHDVTAHSLSIIAVQAGAAEQVVERDPLAAKRALEAIRSTSKSSLDELRAILGVLRGSDYAAPLAPTGSIARIPELAAAVEETGVRVDVVLDGVGEVPAYAEVSAYRIVQEALTNVVRHANATRADVRVGRENDRLIVEVLDDGSGDAQVKAGHGLAGMRERAVALGGEFEAGPAPGGGFRVRAGIPLTGGAE